MKRAVTLALLAGLLIAAKAAQGAEAEKELKKFQGQWNATALEQEGKEVPAKKLKKANLTLVIKGNKFAFTTPKGKQEGTIRLAPSKSPKTIDLMVTSGKGKDSTILGIYEWDGGKVKIAADKAKRPSEFKSAKGGALVMTLERAAD